MASTKKPAQASTTDRLDRIKRLVVLAMFSDDELMEQLVLKGGNALDLVLGLGTRASVDVDFSMESDFKQDTAEVLKRIERALTDTFRGDGLRPFDITISERPEVVTPEQQAFWGGYRVEFKLIGEARYEELKGDHAKLQRSAIDLGIGSKFAVDISRFEYIAQKEAKEFDGQLIFVYSPTMIVCEKLRAICQQLPEYGEIVRRSRLGSPRARDFFDIFNLVTALKIDLTTPENMELLREIFAAKRVPLGFLGLIEGHRDFHRADYESVKDTVKPGVVVHPFDVYFDFVLGLVKTLKPLWNE